MAQSHKCPPDLHWCLAVILRGVLIPLLVGSLTAGAYIIRMQSEQLSDLRTDLDSANQTISALHNQVMAIQAAYQVRDAMRQEAENVATKQAQALDATSPDWADVYLPDNLLGVFGPNASAGSNNSDAARDTVSGNPGTKLDSQN